MFIPKSADKPSADLQRRVNFIPINVYITLILLSNTRGFFRKDERAQAIIIQ